MPQDDAGLAQGATDDWTPWVYLKLGWREEEAPLPALALTIRFGQHHVKILGGRIWFGLSGGELALRPSSGQFSDAHFWPGSPLEATVQVKRTVRAELSTKRSLSASAKADAQPLGATFSYGSGSEQTVGKVVEDAVELIHWRVRSHGSPMNALWNFEAAPGELCLNGGLLAQEIARFTCAGKTGAVKATFSVYKKDIRPLVADGVWPEDISGAKHAVLRGFVRKAIAKRMGPVVHELELPAPILEVHHG